MTLFGFFKPLVPKKCSGTCGTPIPPEVRRIMKKELIQYYGGAIKARWALRGAYEVWCTSCDPELVDGECPKCEAVGGHNENHAQEG